MSPPTSSEASSSLYDPHLDDPFPDRGGLGHLHRDMASLSLRRNGAHPQNETSAAPLNGTSSYYSTAPHPIHYSFAQAFGERGADAPGPVVVEEADMISAVRFSPSTDMVATGDKGGRIVILKRVNRKRNALTANAARRRRASSTRSQSSSPNRPPGPLLPTYADLEDSDAEGSVDDDDVDPNARHQLTDAPEFRFWTQFQSHEPEFDYLKSMEIEEKINQIQWCRSVAGSQRLIATNDKTIKVWRVHEKDLKTISRFNPRTLSQRSRSLSSYPPPSQPLPAPCRPPTTISISAPSSTTSSTPPSIRQTSASTPSTPSQTSFPSPPPTSTIATSSPSPTTASSPSSPSSATIPTPSFRPRTRTVPSTYSSITFPRLEPLGTIITATPRRTFSNAHAYHINSISLNSDEETFLSADDLRIHLWHLNASGAGFNVLDIKPDNMEELTEVITSAEFHPSHCHLFMYSSSRGIVKLCDLRASALCHSWARKLEEPDHTSTRSSFFSEIIASISDVKFSPDGRYILTRDYMNLRLWDMHMERSPIRVIPVHEHLRTRLCDLYENDCIFDKFQCCFSSDGSSLLTGSYNALFQSYSAHTGLGAAVEASVDFVSGLSARHRYAPHGLGGGLIGGASTTDLDPSRRIMHLDSSPTEQIAAVAAGPALYLYYAARRYPGF